MRLPPNDGLKRLKVGDASLILDNNLTIKDGGATPKLSRRTNYAGVTVTPIEAITGVSTCVAALDHQEGAVAVMLHLMNPVGAVRRLIGRS